MGLTLPAGWEMGQADAMNDDEKKRFKDICNGAEAAGSSEYVTIKRSELCWLIEQIAGTKPKPPKKIET